MIKKQVLILYGISVILMFFLSSCSNSLFKVMERSGNCPIMLEARTWHGLFNRRGGFELRFTNQTDNKITCLNLIFDHKYSHSWDGLYSTERGLIKDSTIYPHEVITIPFSEDISNQDYYNFPEDGFIPEEINMECRDCTSSWKLN